MGIPRARTRGALSPITLIVAASVAAAGTAMPAGDTGTLSVTVRSTALPRPPLRVTIDTAICGQTVPDESVMATNGLIAHAVVTLPGLKALQPATVDVANDKCRFVPHVTIAAPSASIRIVSHDATLHTVHAQHQGKSLFNVGLPVPALTLTRPLRGHGPVTLRCNTHPWMSGHVFLTDDRAALSRQDGVALFEQIPAGTHAVTVWHEALGTTHIKATVSAGQRTTVDVTFPDK